jgi:UDP-N-acetylglucosamine 2-epimerase (non-hydrolysing)
MHKKFAIVLGTRPEAIKLIPVYIELKKRGSVVDLISTGQHRSMLDQIFQFFEITPDVSLEVMVHDQTLSGLTARLTNALQECFEAGEYDVVLVQGDTTTAMVASLVAYYNHLVVAHVEAGLRTYNKYSPFPEEINRQVISRIADHHFAPTKFAESILKTEQTKGVHVVGNTVIDSLLFCLDKVTKQENCYKEKFPFLEKYEKLVLITGHRRESFGKGFDEICQAIKALSQRYDQILFYYPVHLNPNVKNKVHDVLADIPNVYLGEPLPYDELVYLMSRSFIILTDSGGIQEEAPSLNVPVLVMRETTERPEGIEAGCSKLVGTDRQRIVGSFAELIDLPEKYRQMANAMNPYGDGRSAQRITDILLSEI